MRGCEGGSGHTAAIVCSVPSLFVVRSKTFKMTDGTLNLNHKNRREVETTSIRTDGTLKLQGTNTDGKLKLHYRRWSFVFKIGILNFEIPEAPQTPAQPTCACVCVCVYVCMRMCMCVFMCICVRVYVLLALEPLKGLN